MLKSDPKQQPENIITMETREAILEIKELLKLYLKFIVSGKELEIEIAKGCLNIVICHKVHSSPDNSQDYKIFNLMYQALNGGLKEGLGELKIQEMYDLHKFLRGSKIKI